MILELVLDLITKIVLRYLNLLNDQTCLSISFKHLYVGIRIPHIGDLHSLKLVIRHCLISTITDILTNEVY